MCICMYVCYVFRLYMCIVYTYVCCSQLVSYLVVSVVETAILSYCLYTSSQAIARAFEKRILYDFYRLPMSLSVIN